MSDSQSRASLASGVIYKDPVAAIEWLTSAIGFEPTMVITDETGKLVHSELKFGNGYIMVADEWTDNMRSPRTVDGTNTQCIHVQLDNDIDGHCERLRSAGATIVAEPEDQFYGDRTYRALDPEGHLWTFAQSVRQVSNLEMEAATGLHIRDSL